MPKVLLISETGEQIGVVPVEDARRRAVEAELDLVEVAPQANPPVCRIYDYKKVIYEQKRRLKESRKKARTSELKECKMRVTIDPHDRMTKLRNVRRFLEKGDKVKFTLQFRGREVTKPQLGHALVKAIEGDLKDIGEIEKPAARQDRFITLIMTRRKDWKPGKTDSGPLEPEPLDDDE
ncbi:MAG: translation initiation factor [Candidatus Sumerlaeota bacterium]|nr:translation initiation factor [Candidatus Sumerlaeota bacterium]